MSRAGLIVLASAVAMMGLTDPVRGQEVPIRRFITSDGQRPGGLFAPGVMVGKTLYISGKGDYRPDDDLGGKVRNCLNKINETLEMAGLSKRHVVKAFCYLEEPSWYDEFNEHYGAFFDRDPPARTTLGVPHVPGESRIEITCIAYADLSEKRVLGAPGPGGRPYSAGVLAGETLYISGRGDQLPDGGHPETFEEQVRQTMRNVEATLREAGLDFRHVVMSHVFLDNYDNFATANRVYGEFFEPGDEPACATVFVDWIPGGSHVEITCIATTDLSGRKPVRPAGVRIGPAGAAVAASPAVWAGHTLYLSGRGGLRPDGGIAAGDVAAQVHQMARNHTAVLEAAGLTLEDIIAGWVYLRDIEDYRPMNEVYREYFSRGPGVRTTLMPNSGYERNDLRVRSSFIAARTRPAE